ncbi:MAG TPA: hypothetical protein VF940_27865 [Streptosporangiaceae bacterium]
MSSPDRSLSVTMTVPGWAVSRLVVRHLAGFLAFAEELGVSLDSRRADVRPPSPVVTCSGSLFLLAGGHVNHRDPANFNELT